MSTATLPPRITPRAAYAGILRDDVVYADPAAVERPDFNTKINGAFDRLMIQSGLETSPPMMLAICGCAAFALGGLAFVLQENLLTTAIAAAIGAVIPILIVMVVRSRRQREMMKQLPDAVEELARAARTGRSLEDCLRLVANETRPPLGDELKRVTSRMALGLDIESALRELPQRTGLTSLNVLVCALAVHNETGGDLVAVLERVSRAIRDRISFLGRLRAATIGSRATTVLMMILPIGALAFFLFRDPNYLNDLFETFWGRLLTITAIVLQVIGLLWVLKIMRQTEKA